MFYGHLSHTPEDERPFKEKLYKAPARECVLNYRELKHRKRLPLAIPRRDTEQMSGRQQKENTPERVHLPFYEQAYELTEAGQATVTQALLSWQCCTSAATHTHSRPDISDTDPPAFVAPFLKSQVSPADQHVYLSKSETLFLVLIQDIFLAYSE